MFGEEKNWSRDYKNRIGGKMWAKLELHSIPPILWHDVPRIFLVTSFEKPIFTLSLASKYGTP